MSHLDPDELALLALGESVDGVDRTAHLAECPECRDELAALSRTVRIGRSSIDSELEAPPERVWSRIAEELALTTADAAAPASLSTHAPPPEPRPGLRRRRIVVWTLAAALVVVAGIAVGTAIAVQQTAATTVAEASLDAFPDHPGARGSAIVEVDRAGARVVHVTLDADARPDTYREVWLITGDGTALISLGLLDGPEGSFPVPAAVDLDDYTLVDISSEPVDGDPAHSGDSIVRGRLSFL